MVFSTKVVAVGEARRDGILHVFYGKEPHNLPTNWMKSVRGIAVGDDSQVLV